MGHDVAARLRDGQAALDNLQKCIDACGLAGYRLVDVYGSEDGLDLAALDADADALRTAAARADQAAELVRAQPGRLSEAWRGPAGEQAADLVGRHAAAAARLASAVRIAAEACATLGAELWRIVDARVARTQTVAGAVRPEWLTGQIAGDELKAFAHNIILGEWTAAMRQADDDARAVYRRAIGTLDVAGPIGFPVPGPLSTGVPPAPPPTVPASTAPPTVPASAAPPTVPASTAPPTIPAPVLPLLPTPQVPHASPIPLDTYGSGPLQPPVPPMSAPAALPSMPMPDLSGGPPTMPHFASEELGTPEKPVPESHGDSEKPETDKPEPDKPEPDKPEPDKPEPDKPEPDKPESEPSPETPPDAAPELPVPPPEPAPVPAPQPAPEPEPSATPCEIAADQLPQVGS